MTPPPHPHPASAAALAATAPPGASPRLPQTPSSIAPNISANPASLKSAAPSPVGSAAAISPWSPQEQQTLLRLLEDQVKQYQSLVDLTRQQGELVDRQDADALLSLLGRRQTFIDRLTNLNGELQPLRENWDARLARSSADIKQNITGLLAQIQQLQQAIQKQDDRDFSLLETAKNQTGQEIGRFKQTAQATRSYSQGINAYRSMPTSLYTDRRY